MLTESGSLDHDWSVHTLQLGEHLAGAIAVEGEGWRMQLFDAAHVDSLRVFPPCSVLSQLPKKLLQELLTVLGAQSGDDLDTMVQARLERNVHDGSAGAGLGIGGSEHQSWNTSQDNGADTHGAGFQRHIEGRVG